VFFYVYVLFCTILDAVCVRSAFLSDIGRSAPVESDKTSRRGLLHLRLCPAILVAVCVQSVMLKETSATFRSLAHARSTSGHPCR